MNSNFLRTKIVLFLKIMVSIEGTNGLGVTNSHILQCTLSTYLHPNFPRLLQREFNVRYHSQALTRPSALVKLVDEATPPLLVVVCILVDP